MNLTKLNLGLRGAMLGLVVLAVATPILAQRPHSTAADSPEWNQAAKDQVLDKMSSLIVKAAYVPGVDFSKWDEVLAKIKPQAAKAQTEDEFAGIVDNGLHDAFKISHIVLLPPSAVRQRVDHSLVGIGIRIDPLAVPDGILVTGMVPGAPAEKAGIEAGDVILEADGHRAERQYIAGPKGTSVTLKVRKGDGKTIKTYKVVREPFSTTQK
ncbi:MAG: S41 family peptidase, partial [Fimbriimonadales bacterium]